MSEMICTCRAEGVREVEARRLRIFHRMGLDDTGELTTAIILSLGFDFQASVELGADMWFGVYLGSPLLAGLPEEEWAALKGYVWEGRRYISVECDWPWDGLAFLWERLAEKFPDRVSVKTDTSALQVRAADRVSAAMLLQYETAEGAYRDHRTAAHKDDNDCPPCEDCNTLMSVSIEAHKTLDELWGSRALEQAVEKAFE